MTTYRITAKTFNHNRAEERTGTLNELRAWLIEEATRWEWNLEGLQDTADAIYDDEPLPDATVDEVRSIAAKVWDESPKCITIAEVQTIDYSDLADRIEQTTGMSREAVTSAMDTYIQQIEDNDDRAIDTDAIAMDDADFIEGAIKSAMRVGDLGTRELETLDEHMANFRSLEDSYHDARIERDRLIRAARAAGARQTDIASTTGLNVAMIRRITNE